MLQDTLSLCSFLGLPPEIRSQIYRLLLLSDRTIRMAPPPHDQVHNLCPNNLFPAILRTCRLIYYESRNVLYGENLFGGHRIDSTNRNTALIRRAKYRIGGYNRENGEDEARQLAESLQLHPNLEYLELEFRFDLIEDSNIPNIVERAVTSQGSLMGIKVRSWTGLNFAWRLFQIVNGQALIREHRSRMLLE